MTLIAELMASVAVLSACGGGGDSAVDVAADDVTPQQSDGTVAALARRTSSSIGYASTLPSGYVWCAGEWSSTTCQFSGNTVLYYGVPGSYRYRSVSGPFDCNTGNTIFGDPAPGVAKACYIGSATAPAPAPAPPDAAPAPTAPPTPPTP